MAADQTLEDRLVAARERKAAAEREAEPSLEEQVAAAEREADEAEALAAAQREHGAENVACADTRLGRVIVKRAHIAKFKQFVDSDRVTADSIEGFVRPCIVYPDRGKADALLAELPAVWGELAIKLQQLSGARAEVFGKKS